MHNRKFARGEVAEPGLRRTPGTRVDSKGSRGFESPPLRQPVRDFRVICRKLENDAHVRAFSWTKGTGESQIPVLSANLGAILCVENRAGAPSHFLLAH